MADRFLVGRAPDGALAGALPVRNSLGTEPGLRVVMGYQLGLRLGGLRELRGQRFGNPLMILLTHGAQQRLVGGLLDERVLEQVSRVGLGPLHVDQAGLQELLQGFVHGRGVEGGDGPQQLVWECPAQHRGKLRHRFRGTQTIETRDERVVQRGGNGEDQRRRRQLVTVLRLAEQTRLQDHLRQLFDEQRVPIGVGHELLEHGLRHPLALGHAGDHVRRLIAGQGCELDPSIVAAAVPRRLELRAEDEQREQWDRRVVIEEQADQLYRRRVDPVKVLHDEQQGLRAGDRPQHRHNRFEGARPLTLRAQCQGTITIFGKWHRQKGGEQRDHVRQGDVVRSQQGLDLLQPLGRGVLATPA